MSTVSVPTPGEIKAIQHGTTAAMLVEPLARFAMKKLLMQVATTLESEAAQIIIRQIVNKLAQKIVTQIAMHAVVTGVSRAMVAGVLASMGPIGWVIDGVMFAFTIVGMIYDHIDPHNYAQTYYRTTIQEMLNDIETQSRYETYKFAKSANLDFDYPLELSGADIFDSREWKLDVVKSVQNSLSYADQLVSNIYKNSRGEIIDLEALCETDEDIDRSLLTHPPAWNRTVQHSIETVISSQERAHAIHQELDRGCKLLEGLAPLGWISILSVGCTIALYDLSKRKLNSSHRATNRPTEFMKH